MFRKIGITLALGVLVGIGITTPASAKARYTIVDSYSIARPLRYHNRDTATHYLWNWNHTAVLHNLRNYPHTTWYVTQSALWKHGTTVARYYYLVSSNHRTSGWVWHKYVTAGTAIKKASNPIDGSHLTTLPSGQLWSTDLTGNVLVRLQDDGFTNNKYLDILNDYNASNDHTPNTFPLSRSIAIEKLGRHINPADVSAVQLDNVPDLDYWIDPKNGNVQLETTGRGQLGSHIATWAEGQMKAHHATRYSLNIHLTGQLAPHKLHMQLIIYMLP